MYVDPAVTRAKFDRELLDFERLSATYQRRGIWLLERNFPLVLVAFVALNAKPTPLVPFGALIDFTNYDVAPLSVRFVHVATKQPLKASELPPFLRLRADRQGEQLIQAFEDERPFICLRGVREYHDSPAHSGDSWFLHRGSGVGKLAHVVDILARYGSEPVQSARVQMQLIVSGFAVSPPQP